MPIPPTSFLKYDISDIACYPGSGTVITDLNANLNGTITSAGLFVSDGQQSYINITSGSQRLQSNTYNFPVRNVYTISSIFKTSAQNDYNTIISLAEGDGSGTVPFFSVNFNNTAEFNFPFSSNGFGVGNITGNLKLQNDTWNLLTLTADGTTQKLYLNGILVGSVAHTASFNGSNPRLQSGYPGTTQYAAIQKIAIMQMWESALTAAQVKDLADSYRTRFSLYQPVVSYDFSVSQSYPGSGSTFYDLAGSTNGNTNSTTFVSDGPASYFTTNGSSTYLSTSSFTPSSSTVFSYHLWCQLNNNTYGTMFQMGGDGSSIPNTPAININDPSTGRLLVSFGYGVSFNNPSQTIPVNTWKCISVVCDGTTNKVYYDGVLINSISQSTGTFGVGPINFGRFVSSQFASVKIALFELYNTALSDSDVTAFYNETSYRFDNLVVSYDFSDPLCYPGTGNTVFDLSGNSLNLPIVGATYAGTGQSKYFNFDGNGDYIGKTGVSGLGDTFTTNIWYQVGVVNATGRQLWNVGVNSASGTNPGFYLNYPSTADLIYGFSFGVGTTSAADVLTANTWQMATVTADGTTTKLYVDGVLAGSVAQGIGNWATGGFAIGAGVDGSGNISAGADGLLGKVALLDIYNTALSAGDITTIYNDTETRFFPVTPPYAGIVGGRQLSQGFNG